MTHDGVEHTKHDGVEELIAALERAPAIVIPLVRQADPAIVKRRPAPGAPTFRGRSRRLVDRLRSFRPEEWTRTARHEEHNAYSVFMMFRHLALHDFHHAYRIEELLLRKDWPAPSAPDLSGRPAT